MLPIHTGRSLFNVKRLMLLGLLVLMLSILLVLTARVVFVHVPYPMLANWVDHALSPVVLQE